MSICQLGIIAQDILKRGHGKILEDAAQFHFRGFEIDV
jgi:hypothetical protein